MSDENEKEQNPKAELNSETDQPVIASEKEDVKDAESDKQDQPVIASEKEDVKDTESDKQDQSAPEKAARTSIFSILSVLFSVITVVVVALAGYFAYMQFAEMSDRLVSLEQNEKNARSAVDQMRASLQRESSATQTRIQQAINSQAAENTQQFQNVSEQLAASRRQLHSMVGRHQSDWLLAEADYLVRIATQRLLLEEDHLTALALLLSADERIMLMDDPALQSVREAIAHDIATLRLVKRVDISGLAIRISSLIPQLKVLPVQSFELPEETMTDIDSTIISAEPSWQDNLKKTLKELSVKWFEVRDHGKPVSPLMSSEKESLLLSNMTLLLQTAQFAILRGHIDLYHHSMGQLKDWGNEYFDTADSAVLAFMNEVDSLSQVSVSANLPETLESRMILSREVEQ